MRRRDFLSPKQLARSAAQVLDVVEQVRAVERELADDAVLLRFARRAMATTFEVVFPLGTPHAQDWADAALDEIDRLEAQLTVYRDDSEVSRLNARAATAPIAVEESLFQLLARAKGLWQTTGAAFDVAVGALIKAWGFYRREGRVPSDDQLAAARQESGLEHVTLEPDGRLVSFARPGVEINLGSIGKGYALDRAARLLWREAGIRHALVHGGHSSVFALGSEPGRRDGWSIGLLHPDPSDRRLGVLRLRDRALGVSAATYQYFIHDGRTLGHILDPRTGRPAEGMALAAATAPTAAEADAMATAFFVLGVEGARASCEQNAHLGAILLPVGENQRTVVIGTARNEIMV